MIEVNLLPKAYRKRTKTFRFDKKATYMAVTAGVIALLLVVVTLYQKYQLTSIAGKIAHASAEKARLQEDIRVIDDLTVLKERIIMRMEAIEKLDRYRSTWVRVLEDLNQRVPEYMWLTRVSEIAQDASVKKQPKNIPGQDVAVDSTEKTEFAMFDKPVPTEIEGYAFTLNSIASFLIGLTKSEFFENIDLAFAREEEVMGIGTYKFRVMCDLVFDKALDEAEPLEDVWEPTIAER